jgi:hypothetical protein
MEAIEQLTVDVELALPIGAIADPHRAPAAIAVEMLQDLLGQPLAAVDPVHDLQRAILRLVAEALDEPEEALGSRCPGHSAGHRERAHTRRPGPSGRGPSPAAVRGALRSRRL